MKIAILGYGKEGKSAENFFRTLTDAAPEIQIFDQFNQAQLDQLDLSDFELVLRSPSVPPRAGWSSTTKYFFEHCPCTIIGVTGTKGKGTTCSMVAAILKELGQTTWLVGNIGTPALDVLKQIQPQDVVIYELSSFQLWDLDRSPQIAAVLRIEPDHLNIHGSFENYTNAKANITRWQQAGDTCVYYAPNPESAKIAQLSAGQLLPYPLTERPPLLEKVLDAPTLPGAHNRENAEAALLIAASFFHLSLKDFLAQYHQPVAHALHHFHGLPHRLEFLRTLNGVDYYDDTFSTTPPALQVALQAFPGHRLVPIIGGRDKTANADLPEIANLIQTAPGLIKVVLIGESGHDLAKILPPERYFVAQTLPIAVQAARQIAESAIPESSTQTTTQEPSTEETVAAATTANAPEQHPVVLMSPTAASFDMFKNEFDRGEQYQQLIRALK